MTKRMARCSGAALLAAAMAWLVLAHEAEAACNPPDGVFTELLTFTVKDQNDTGSFATAAPTPVPASNPKKLYICQGAAGTAKIEMSATIGAGSPEHVGWRIEKATGKGTAGDADLVSDGTTGHADPNQGKVTPPDNQSTLTVTSSDGDVRTFYVKAFCDGNKDGKMGPDEDYYYDTTPITPKPIEVQVFVLKMELEETSTKNFSPQLGETATLDVKLEPTPPSGGYPGLYFQLEIVRILNGGSEQHVQWIDVDPTTPALIDLACDADFSTLSLTWNGIPDALLDGNAAQAEGPDVFIGISANFNRKLPAVTAGQCVPPPLYYAVARLKKTSGLSTFCESVRPVYVPQVVQVEYATEAMDLLKEPFVVDGTTVVAALSDSEVLALKASVPSDVTSRYGSAVNLRCGSYSSVSAPYSLVSFISGTGASPLGQADATDFGNVDPGKTARVYVYRHRLSCANEYILNPSFSVPVTPSEMNKWIPNTTTHEIGHLLGLVKDNAVLDGTSGTHNKLPWTPRQIMNPGSAGSVDADLWRTGTWSFKPLNQSYVEFVLPGP